MTVIEVLSGSGFSLQGSLARMFALVESSEKLGTSSKLVLMCGRYTLKTPAKELAALFGRPSLPFADLSPRYNIAPSQACPVVRVREGEPEVATPTWGLLPRFIADPKASQRPINARAETVATNGFFRQAFARRRCLIPADGFYEPEEDATLARKEKKTGRWWYFKFEDDRPFAFAGLWETWGERDSYLETFTLITTEPMEVVSRCGHGRSPLILPPESFDLWLDAEAKPPQLKKLLRPHPSDEMTGFPIDGRAKNARNQGPELIEPLAE